MDATHLRSVEGRYGQLAFFVNDSGAIARSLALYGEWAENEIGFMRQFAPPGATVLDIGAYIGTHTLAFARMVGPDGHVIAFEAQPVAFGVLERNVTANQLKNVRVENVVVSDRPGAIVIPTIDIDQSGSFGSASVSAELHTAPRENQAAIGPGSHTVEARSIAIDELELAQCDLLKIDAEGAEDLIIRGAERTIERLRPVIYAECNSVEEGLRTVEVMRASGYAVRLHIVDAFNADNFLGATENVFDRAREAALVGVPPERVRELDLYIPRACELLVRVASADDLVLGLLNKPQYPQEVLRPSAAAADGAAVWLDGMTQQRLDVERFEQHAAAAKQILTEERASSEKRIGDAYASFAGERADFERRIADAYGSFAGERADFEKRIADAYGSFADERADFEKRIADAYGAFAEERAGYEKRITDAHGAFAEERVDYEKRITDAHGAFAEERAGYEKQIADASQALFEERDRLAEARGLLESTRRELQMTNERLSTALREQQEITATLSKAQADLADAQAMSEAAMRQAALSRAAADNARAIADTATQSRDEALQRLETVQSSLDAEVRSLTLEVERLSGLLTAVHRSTSWRLTRPLRWARKLLRS